MSEYLNLHQAMRELLVFSPVLQAQPAKLMDELVEQLVQPGPPATPLYRLYAALFMSLAEQAELNATELVGNAWQNFLLESLLLTPNLLAQKVRLALPGASLLAAARHDLTRLQLLFGLDLAALGNKIRLLAKTNDLPDLLNFTNLPKPAASLSSQGQALKQKLATATEWSACLPDLLEFYRSYDASDFARYHAFRWRQGKLEPVPVYDPQRLEDLVGYEREREQVVANTVQFLAGAGANNVLLYGARGTGKSSTVKGLLNRYSAQGLRIIEVQKNELGDYPLIAELVRQRPEKFLLFIDDLSFEADEVSYKDLKALLEGNLEARPQNLLIYATSNRRHLVKEFFQDNPRPDNEEVAAWDTVEEKISLSDRFGLNITFISPTQREYLQIVDALAKLAGIEMQQEILHRRALQWELSHSGRSGRVARQFVDQLAGELAIQNKQAQA